MDKIYEALAEIVGPRCVSAAEEELYLYARDPGTMEPRRPDYVALPRTAEEVQKIVLLANEAKLPVVPQGGGLVLSGLTIPQRGGILLDMKRMDRIIEVNEAGRYAVVEAGVSGGALLAYLKKNHPRLRHSEPDAPPIATVAGNALIHGSGRLSQCYGFHGEMINGLEVVLPTGEICRVGTCSVLESWFARAPLPDLAGLFIGWFGTTGIVTRLSFKLYPRKSLRDVMVFVTDNPEHVSDVIYRIADTEMAEDLNIFAQSAPDYLAGTQNTAALITGDSEEEIEFKKRLIRCALRDYVHSKDGGFMVIPPEMKATFLETPTTSVTRFADFKQGGGFEYVGGILTVDRFAEAYRRGIAIADKYGSPYALTIRVVGRAHCMMFAFAYAFNRASPEDMDTARKQLHEANEAVLELGGVPWKAEIPAQQMILARTDPQTVRLMRAIRGLLDPNGIMNPGQWEVG